MRMRFKAWPWLVLAALVTLADQLTKGWVAAYLGNGESEAVTGFFNLVLVHNSGAAFSFLANAGGWQHWLFLALALAVSVWIMTMLCRQDTGRRLSLALALILGGALGNVIDRLNQGAVVDFLDFHWGGYHWPAFNLADSAIMLGAALMVFDQLLGARHRKESA